MVGGTRRPKKRDCRCSLLLRWSFSSPRPPPLLFLGGTATAVIQARAATEKGLEAVKEESSFNYSLPEKAEQYSAFLLFCSNIIFEKRPKNDSLLFFSRVSRLATAAAATEGGSKNSSTTMPTGPRQEEEAIAASNHHCRGEVPSRTDAAPPTQCKPVVVDSGAEEEGCGKNCGGGR